MTLHLYTLYYLTIATTLYMTSPGLISFATASLYLLTLFDDQTLRKHPGSASLEEVSSA